ncbi:MAG: hypothetical protein HY319_13620 [Armatimonadetes bacterium]|nr:hypothetical protein [Armatimonadota bacterium]
MDLWKSLQIVRQRKWVFLAATLLALAIVFMAPKKGSQDPMYVSYAKLLLTPQTAQVKAYGGSLGPGGPAPGVQWWLADDTSMKELIASEELLQRVVQRAELTMDWRNLGGRVQINTGEADRRGQLTFFQLGVEADTPEEAQKLTTILVDEFVAYVQELSGREYSETRRFLEELVAEAQQKVAESEQALLDLQTTTAGLTDDASETAATRAALEERRTQLKAEILGTEAQVAAIANYLDGKNPVPPWTVLENKDSTVDALNKALAEHQLKLVELQQVYTPESRQVREQVERLNQVKALYDRQLRTYVESLYQAKTVGVQEQREALLAVQQELNTMRREKARPEKKLELQKLERQLTVWSENQLNLVQQLYQARIAEQSSRRQGAIAIIQKPQTGAPTGGYIAPPAWKTMALALPFCLFFGVAMALLSDYLNSSFQMLPRVEETLDLPVVCVIPTVPAEIADEWERIKRNGNGGALAKVGANGNGVGANGSHKNGHPNGSPKNGYPNGSHQNGHQNGSQPKE